MHFQSSFQSTAINAQRENHQCPLPHIKINTHYFAFSIQWQITIKDWRQAGAELCQAKYKHIIGSLFDCYLSQTQPTKAKNKHKPWKFPSSRQTLFFGRGYLPEVLWQIGSYLPKVLWQTRGYLPEVLRQIRRNLPKKRQCSNKTWSSVSNSSLALFLCSLA